MCLHSQSNLLSIGRNQNAVTRSPKTRALFSANEQLGLTKKKRALPLFFPRSTNIDYLLFRSDFLVESEIQLIYRLRGHRFLNFEVTQSWLVDPYEFLAHSLFSPYSTTKTWKIFCLLIVIKAAQK